MIKKVLLAAMILLLVNVAKSFAQPNVFDPNDRVDTYNTSNPPATPPVNTIAKWFRTPSLPWNTDKFKPYYYNDMVFRIRYPDFYNPADTTKKYPVILFFSGGGEVAPITDNEIQLINGAEKFQGMIDAGQFNAFLVFPQEKVLGWDYTYLTRINDVMDSMQKYCNTDPDRVISMGLSAGGYGAMSYTIGFPSRVATTIAASPALIDNLPQDATSFVHVPFWISSGGTDANPNPTVTQNFVDTFAHKGGSIRYNFYPTLGHNTWDNQWEEPYLLPTWLSAHKANPLIYFNRSKFISASVITARIGITQGYFQYQWQKDNVDLPGAVSNEILPNQFGSYRVRFKRFSYSNWSAWSPNPAVISQDNVAPTVPTNVKSLFAGRTFVNLDWNNSTDNDSVTRYDVYVNGIKKYSTNGSAITADNLIAGTSYIFTIKAFDQAGNASDFSAPLTASTTSVSNGLNYRYYEGNWIVLPDFNTLTPVKTGVSPNINITLGTPGVVNLFGYVWEGYIRIKTPGTYTFETNSDDGSKLYFNSFYSPTAKALVNNDGVHAAWINTGTISIPTPGLYPIAITFFDEYNSHAMEAYWTGPGFSRSLIPDSVFLDTLVNTNDNTPPTTPANLKVVNTGASFFDLDWDNSTDDIAVNSYDIYINNVKKYSSPTSSFTANNLSPNTTYQISVKALDKAGNASGFSNVVTATTNATASGGLRYKYYEGTWSTLPDFSTLTPVKTGTTPNIDITVGTPGLNYNFAYVWEGNINITTPGSYTFETVSDDGSRFYYNTFYSPTAIPLADNDGIHAAQSALGTVTIGTPGLYPVAITYFQKDGGANMQIFWTGPGISRQLIPNSAFIETVTNTGDVTPPSVPANLKYYNTGNTFVTLDWDNSTDNVAVTGYDIYVNNVKKYTSAESAITADSLMPNTAYTFTVAAHDQAGNVSAMSNAITVTTSSSFSGLQYRYYEGNYSVLPNFNTLTPVKSGSTPNIDIITPRNRADSFAFVWEGYIKIPIAGTYTFETVSDDGSKLYFNSFYSPSANALVTNDGLHGPTSVSANISIAAAGTYPISMTFFESTGGESMQVYWSGPGIPRQLIPNAAFVNIPSNSTAPSAPANLKALYTNKTYVNLDWDNSTSTVGITGYDVYVNNVKKYTTTESAITADKLSPNTSYNFSVKAIDLGGNASAASSTVTASTTATVAGLNYRYYEGSWDALPNFNTLTPVKSGGTPNLDITTRTPGVNDYFAYVWEGYLNFTYAGAYTIELYSDDGSKLYFNSLYSPTATPIINNDGLHGPTNVTATVNVPVPGLYPLSVVYFEKDGGEIMQMYISGTNVPRQIVPYVAFMDTNPGTVVQNNAITVIGNGNVLADVAGTSTTSDKIKSLKAYPNPTADWLNLDLYVESNKNDVGVDVIDMNGKLVYKNNFKGLPDGNNTLRINMGDGKMAPGMYFVKVTVNGIPSKVIKLVKSRK